MTTTDFDRYRHEMSMRVTLEAAVNYLATTKALTLDELRERLVGAIDQAHEMADLTCPLDGEVAA